MDKRVGGLRDPIAVGVARTMWGLAGMRQRSNQFLHIGHGDHPDASFFILGAPPLLLWLLENDEDLPLLEGKVLCVAAGEVV